MSLLSNPRVVSRATALPTELLVACLHSSAPSTSHAPSRTRLVKSLRPSPRSPSAKYEVAPTLNREEPPHVGLPPRREHTAVRRPSTHEIEDRLRLKRTEREAEDVSRRPKIVNPLRSELDLSQRSVSTKELPKDFTSPPLMDGFLASIHDVLGHDACPTPIQALSLKHLVRAPDAPHDSTHYHEHLLASETGSGKSIAYLLPMLQDLKQSEILGTQRTGPRSTPKRAMNPRAIVLAPTHELARQLAGFAKELLHHTKLRVQCGSRANVSSRKNMTAERVANMLIENDDGSLEMPGNHRPPKEGPEHAVDVVVGTPSKLLELMRGRGWDYESREPGDGTSRRKVTVGEPEMGLRNVEWVVVDEADVLFDPDFQEHTRAILADVSAARGRPVPSDDLTLSGKPAPHKYPFNLLLTSATIPSALAAHLDAHHPHMTRLASPHLHRLPASLKTEHVSWTGGNKDADVERRLRRVWADDAQAGARLSKVLVFCNKGTRVEALGRALQDKGIANVALTRAGEARKRGSNHHLDGFLRLRDADADSNASLTSTAAGGALPDVKEVPHVMITTSLLSRGLDFAPDVRHVFIVDEPRNMVDFLHRAGRAGRAGAAGKVVVFGKSKGRGSDKARVVRQKVGALRSKA